LQYRFICCGLCKIKRSKVASKDGESSSSSDDEKKKHEYAVKYKDLEILLADFNRAQEVLNKQLIDREAINKRTIDEEGNLVENLSNEDELLKEV
jgi:organic radical activating enzyme